MTEEPFPGYLTISEAINYANLGASLLAQRLRTGRIAGKKIGNTWLIEKVSLDAYLASNRKPGVPRGTKRQPKKEE